CNKWLAIIATSLIFGLVHGHPIGIIYASCLGILMGWLYCKTESLISVIIFHMVYNLFSVISPAMDDVTYVMVGAVGIIISAVCVASIAKLPKYTPKNKNDDNDKNDEV
ncbi:MAG: CPBP family intramembrane metalloprotease, partial [Clostridia bacterium]|nr:CPBP family intramembrane metalloprotease [Clostridia bacterium]